MTRKQAWTGWGSPMHRVAGWDFDHRLNGYITTAADRFSCDCGEEFPTPSGYRKCGSCGRAWNSYVIGTDNHGREASLEKVIVREIPVRKDVIVASKRRRVAGGEMSYEDAMKYIDQTLSEGEKPKFNGTRCVNCGDVAQPPASDWARQRGMSGPLNDNKWQFYWERGDGHPEEYGDIPSHWNPFGSWQHSGYCKDCYRDDYGRQASRRRAKDDSECTCWEGYERVPGTKPCAKGSCRKKAALRYVAWCRQVGRSPNVAGMRRFRTAERLVRIATTPMPEGSHDLDVGNIDNQVNPYSGEGGSPSQIEPILDGFGTIGWRGGSRRRRADKHTLRRIDLRDMEEQEPKDEVSIEHFSSRRRRAELFDITDEGETKKGKGKVNTPGMRQNPKDWADRKQNGQYTKRWN